MSNPATAVRGTTVRFTRVFRDDQGNAFVPTRAVLTVRYATGPNDWKAHFFEMAYDATRGEWWAEWDTRGAYPGRATWSMYAPADDPVGERYDGETILTANRANPQAADDTPEVPPLITTDLTNPINSGTASMLGVF